MRFLRRGILAAAMISCVGLALAEDDPEARAVLDQMIAVYRSAESIVVEGVASSDIKMNGMDVASETDFTILLARSGLYRIDWSQADSPLMDGTLWNAGDEPMMFQQAMNAYYPLSGMLDQIKALLPDLDPAELGEELIEDASMAFGTAAGVSGGASGTLPSLFYDLKAMPGLIAEIENLELAPRETLDGEECLVITGSSQTAPRQTLWISAERHVLLKYEHTIGFSDDFDFNEMLEGEQMEGVFEGLGELVGADDDQYKEMMAGMREMMKEMSGVMGERYSSVTIDAPLQVEDFAFEPPEDAERVDSMFEALQQRMASAGQDNNAKFQVGDMAPDFEGEGPDGEAIKLSDYKGKIVLIDFWATWCAPCIAELPNVIETYEQYHPEGLEIIGVNLDNGKRELDRFMKDRPEMSWKQVFDGKGWASEVGRLYGVDAIPFALLLDGTGKIRHRDLRGSALGEAVAELLAEAEAE